MVLLCKVVKKKDFVGGGAFFFLYAVKEWAICYSAYGNSVVCFAGSLRSQCLISRGLKKWPAYVNCQRLLCQVFSGAVINWEQLSKDWVNSETGERACFEMFRVSVMMVDRP